ncbi:MAG: LCP family protein, partial [Actinophytocola sp.]|uniref:LCP family protein n=1 Tax=Actinophytocola sp. TaxID=1872138 RepID=UPI003D6AFBDC
PGQASGQHPLPPPGGPVPGDPMANEHPPRHPSGAIPRDPSREERPAIPGSRASAEERPGEPKAPLPPPRAASDAISLTTEMEAIGEEVQKRRGIDHTLARFSAVHDEIQAEERQRKAKRRRLMPWRQQEDELDQLDEMVAMQTIAVPQKKNDEPAEPRPATAPAVFDQDPKTRRRKLTIRVFAATAAILVFVATGIAWGFKSWVDASAQQVDALDPNSDSIQDAAAQRGDENFLLVGSDTRAGAEDEDNVGNEDEVLGARSDTVMIAHIPANRERAVIVSFPRDLEISRPACEGWDPESGDYTGEQKPAEEQVKLNSAYQVGGPKCVTKLVQEITGLAINHFVGMDFNGFKGMVDAVDGVPICVEKPLKDDILGTIVPTAGENVQLSGNEALNFVRARHVQGDVTADYGRIQRQQRFLSALLRKAMSSEVLLDPGKLSAFVEAFSKSTFGDNIGVDQMVVLGQSLQGIEAGRVTFVTVPTVGEANDRGNEDLRVEDTNALMSAIRKDSPLPGEKSGAQQLRTGLELRQGGQVDPKTIKLQVFNGGNPTGGIAGDTADQLAGFGYQIVWVDAAPENVERTVIKYAKGREAQAKTLQTSVPDAELAEDPSLAGAVQLIIGPGFDGNIVAPGKGKPAAEPLPEDLSTINGGDVSCA